MKCNFLLSTIAFILFFGSSCQIVKKDSSSTKTGKTNPDRSLLEGFTEPVILHGNERIAFRDPLIFCENDTFYLFYSYVLEEDDHLIYWYIAYSTSQDLINWTEPRIVTPKDQNLNYGSPGSIIKVGDEWLMSAQTYPIVNFRRGDKLRFGDDRARIWLFRSKDLKNWNPKPELLKVKGPNLSEAEQGKMIDSFIFPDRDVPGKWWCVFKQNGYLHCSWSMNLKDWNLFTTNIAFGENPQVFVDDNGEYVLIYAPENGVGVKRSKDLINWKEEETIMLGQKDWPWSEVRLTAGYIADFRSLPGVGKYLMVWHSMGPGKEKTDAVVNANTNIGVAWSDDLKTWNWPGKTQE